MMVHLFLANNKFRVPPTALLNSQENLSRVTLSGKPLGLRLRYHQLQEMDYLKPDVIILLQRQCNLTSKDHQNLQKINAIKTGSQFRMPTLPSADRREKRVQCLQKAIWSLTDLDLCPEDIVLYITLGLLVPGFLLMVAVGKIAWTRYQMHVKVWLYSHGVTWVKEKDIDKDKEFDAFISFSHKDQDLVIPELINVKLFIHYKHFLPGEFIQLNILRAIEVSKRTVLVLSKSFLESEWCMFEFRAAHIEALKDNMNRIIIIKMDDLPRDADLPEEIQVYLQSTTYLMWGDKYFWDTLLYILPRS
ncbi:protein toll [Caerostris extrusa]|uniref:Protein toll n=1 Tax=Caerostris extrusa TaxID=172846 RepID=A0AAV4S1J7_CAEEX|nr:protein toll [Caerostris extrusa]